MNRGKNYIIVPMKRLKTIASDLGHEYIDILKMDIEGSELKALHGGANFIKDNEPNLAICLYHRDCDLIDIPKFVNELCPHVYDFYLVGGSHTIMIAKPH